MIIIRFNKSLKSFIDKQIYLCNSRINPFLLSEAKEIENLSNISTNSTEKLNSNYSPSKDQFNEELFKNSPQLNEKLFTKLINKYQTINSMTFYKKGIKRFSIKYNRSFDDKSLKVGGDYEELLSFNSIFSDKSLFIKEITECSFKNILITMPRRWGKSTNMDMLYRFIGIQIDKKFELVEKKKDGENYKLFFSRHDVKDLEKSLDITHTNIKIVQDNVKKIVTSEYLCCSKPVIYLNLRELEGNNYDSMKSKLKNRFIELFTYQHRYLAHSETQIKKKYQFILNNLLTSTDEEVITSSVYNLSILLYERFEKKVWVLIDEYDSAINHAMLEFEDEDIKKTISLFRSVYNLLLKDNPYIEKGVLTGVLPIVQSGILSVLNNLGKFGIDDSKFSKYYGLNQEEIQKFLNHFNITETQAVQIKNWEKGYKVKSDSTIERVLEDKYNILSVVNCISKRKNRIESYRMDNTLFSLISPLLRKPLMMDIITKLITGNNVYIENITSDFTQIDFKRLRDMIANVNVSSVEKLGYDLLLSYLYYLGYLSNSNEINHYRIPNYEIRKALLLDLTEYYKTIYSVDTELFQEIINLINSILFQQSHKEIEEKLRQFETKFKQLIRDLNNFCGKFIDRNQDTFYSLINILAAFVSNINIGTEIRTDKTISTTKDMANVFIAKFYVGIIIQVSYYNTHKEALFEGKYYLPLIKDKEIQVVVGIKISDHEILEMKYEFIK